MTPTRSGVISQFQFVVPFVPPSVNHYSKHTRAGRHYVTGEATAFKESLAVFCRGQFCEGNEFSLDLLVVLGAKDRGDVDNFPKLVLDGLADCGAFRNKKGKRLTDAHVTEMIVRVNRKIRPEQGMTAIKVTRYL